MAVGSSSVIKEAKLRAEPSCGVADKSIKVSERLANNRANFARLEMPDSPARSATL